MLVKSVLIAQVDLLISGKTRGEDKLKSEKGMDVMLCYEDELEDDDDEETGTDADDDCSNLSVRELREAVTQPATPDKGAKALDLIR